MAPATTRSWRICTGLIAPSLLLVGFGYFLHQSKWIALAALVVGMGLVLVHLSGLSYHGILQVLGLRTCRKPWIIGGALFGFALAILLRGVQQRCFLPVPLHVFATVAVLVGVTEELVFRGYFQGVLMTYGFPAQASVATLMHTAYKVAIFLPFSDSYDLPLLGTLTFIVGWALGWARKATGSIWPCIAMHALFDLWVYGDRLTPWWVW